MTDADDNLDYVNFEWFVNYEKVRTSKKYVYGSSDTAEDLLPHYYTEDGDYVKCKITVFDTEGASDTEYSQPVYVEDGVVPPPPPPYPNKEPVAVLTSGNTYVNVGDYVYLSGVASYDPDGYVIQYYFDFGDGSHSHWLPSSSPYTYHSYSEEGVYYAKLKVKDNKYLESDWSREIAIHVYDGGGYYHDYPRVDWVEIDPQYPDRYDDLFCEASVSDNDGDLDYVRIDWYVNGYLEESRTMNVYGYDDEVSDLFDYYHFDEGDRVKCKITVYDERHRSDSDYDIVTIEDNGHYEDEPRIRSIQIEPDDPDVFDDLTCEVWVEDDDGDLDYVWFRWFVDDEEVREVKKNVYGYDDEVSFDLDSRYFDYKDFVKCEATVYDEEDNHERDYDIVRIGDYPYPSKYCGHSIESFDFSSFVLEGNKAWVEVDVKNTGLRSSTLTLNLFADNSLKDTHTVYLVTGREITKKFEFSLPLGTHDIRLESYLSCGSPVNKYASIIVYKYGGGVIIPPEPPPEPPEITETFVSITPTQLDIEIYRGKTIEIKIDSPSEQTFKIEVLDLHEDWVNYPKEVKVDGRERIYAYIVPKELGEYTFRVKVTTGDKTFEETIDLYVAPEGELTGDGGFDVTGLITAEGNWVVGLIIVVIIAVIIVVYLANKKFRKKTYQEHLYGERRYPEEPHPSRQPIGSGMMKGSAGSVSPPEERMIPAETDRYSDLSYFPRKGSDFSQRQSS
ncbi:MAG: PKD domain-containing protein [Candidatus Aenigmarchaeota archaeon]|nr:PKD domain-containing protein [Candidatus Aenigmarchaeota archaeon]